MICFGNVKPIFPATKSRIEVPSVFQEDGIVLGFRLPDQPWWYYVASLFQPHNETLNMWTHLVGMFLVVFTGFRFCEEGYSLVYDPLFWPLLCGLGSTFLMYFFSTTAHTFQSRSEFSHYLFFMLDYAGIGLYGMASGVLHFIYCSCDEFYDISRKFFIFGCIVTGIYACVGNCLSKVMFQKPYPKSRALWQAVPILLMYLWIILPIVYRLWRYGFAGDEVYSPALPFHCRQIICFVIGGIVYVTQLPQSLFPGKFDILGHSHQIFHLFIIFTTLNQFSGIIIDLKNIDRSTLVKRHAYNAVFAIYPLIVTLSLQLMAIFYFSRIMKKKIQGRESHSDSKDLKLKSG